MPRGIAIKVVTGFIFFQFNMPLCKQSIPVALASMWHLKTDTWWFIGRWFQEEVVEDNLIRH